MTPTRRDKPGGSLPDLFAGDDPPIAHFRGRYIAKLAAHGRRAGEFHFGVAAGVSCHPAGAIGKRRFDEHPQPAAEELAEVCVAKLRFQFGHPPARSAFTGGGI